MHHTAAFYEQIDALGAATQLAAVNDQVLKVSGDDLYVPEDLPFLVGEGATIETTSDVQAYVRTPSLISYGGHQIIPYSVGTTFTDGHKSNLHPDRPIALVGGEAMNLFHENNPAGATDQFGFVNFSDGPAQKVNDSFFTIRCTMSITAVLGAWVNGALTFPQDLPIGNYDVVGMRCVEATTVLARLLFNDQSWRPGVAAAQDTQDNDNPFNRYGESGVWGSFATNHEPSVDILANAAGAITPTIYLDLVRK